MAKEDIHNTRELLNRKAEGYISQLFTEDQEDTRRFINDLLAQGFSAARVLKMLSTLSSIRKRLKKPFKNVTANELKNFSAGLEQSDYAEWTKHDLKVILRRFLVATGKGNEIAWLKIKTVKNGKLPELFGASHCDFLTASDSRHRVGYELRFINEHEKASVAEFFIPGTEAQRAFWSNSLCLGGSYFYTIVKFRASSD